MIRMHAIHVRLSVVVVVFHSMVAWGQPQTAPYPPPSRPNILLIYVDDVGYGDVGCYGATKVKTPKIDRLAKEGIRFTDAHATSATCTPSRYSLLTGQYAFRNKRAAILSGNASLLIKPGSFTLPEMLKRSGYATACIGKWHLGLGDGKIDWNGEIKPGPLDVGFDISYILPATNDRVPCVYLDGHRVDKLDASDPLSVSYRTRVGDLPTGKSNPELLRYPADGQHSGTIINRISRIGFMTGARSAWWVDEEMTDHLTRRAIAFMEQHKNRQFFLYYSLHNIHEPRAPHPRFKGTSDCGTRGDAIAEMDWSVGELVSAIDRLGIRERTLVIFTSDNGPVITDGYADGSLEKINGHDPNGPYRGGKYQAWEGGTRLPFIARWPERIRPGKSDAMISQVDLLASLAKLVGSDVPTGAAVDSQDMLPALLGKSKQGRDVLLEQAPGVVSIRRGPWKYIPSGKRVGWTIAKHSKVGDPTGDSELAPLAHLFNVSNDPGERRNLIDDHPEIAAEMAMLLAKTRSTKP